LVVLWTDGIFEAASPRGNRFGEQRALDLVCEHAAKPARDIVAALYQGVRSFTDGQPQHDDMTAIVLKV
jgi:sigma-B regulation protein RsbU (phosphoserine phosphatase)